MPRSLSFTSRYLSLIALLLVGCDSILIIKTNEAELDCRVLMEDAYCIKVRTAEIDSVKDLVINQDKVLTNEHNFTLSWTMPEKAKRILATKVMLASDATCTKEVAAVELEIKQLTHKFSDIKDGIYYGCVFANAKSAAYLGAKNNGIRIVVETADPSVQLQSKVVYTNTGVLNQNASVQAISNIKYIWTKIEGPGELIFSDRNAAKPAFTATVDGSYVVTVQAINEVGGKTTRTITIIYDTTPPILMDIAPITTSAPSIAIKAESQDAATAYSWEILTAPGNSVPDLKDTNTATAELQMKNLGVYKLKVSLTDAAGNVGSTTVTVTKVPSVATVILDTTKPTPPSGITVPAYSNSATVKATYTAGTDANFLTHNVKVCTTSTCSTGCLSASEDIDSPVTLGSLVNGSSYFLCLQAVDLSGNLSDYVASTQSVKIDTTLPLAPSSLGFSGSISGLTSLSVAFAIGTDANFFTHEARLCTATNCTTGCGAITQAVMSPVSLVGATSTTYYGCARSIDLAGNTSAWVPSVGTLTIDTTNPTAPSGVTVSTYSNMTSVNVTYTPGTDANFATHNVKACTNFGCSAGCVGTTTDVASPVTVGSLVNGTAYWICLQTVDQVNNLSAFVASGNSVTIDTTNPAAPSSITLSATYTGSTTASITWTNGTDTNFSTHSLRACTDSGCSASCVASAQDSASPGSLTGLFDGSIYYACVQSVDLATNVSAWIPSAGTTKIDTTNPGVPTAVSFSNIFALSFTPGAETNPFIFNLKACTNAGCSTACVGSTTTAASPGSISGAAMTVNTAYYGCVQATDLAGNTSAFVASGATSTRYPYTVTYSANSSTSGSVPTDALTYAAGHTVTVLGNTGTLAKTGYSFASWNTAANGTGTSYTGGQTFVMGTADVNLYAQSTFDCSGLAGGTWVAVPGDYGNPRFCVQKYAPSNVSSVPTSQAGTAPWVDISQTTSISTCAILGTGYHLITNPEWMNVAANLANVASNWSGGSIGSGTLRRGHSDNNPASACAANASDANAYVETDCTGSSSGTFVERRTSTLSNGAVVWDIGGNVWNWVNYINSADKPTPATIAWYEYTAITGTATTPKSHLVPLNRAQSWWTDSWNSSQGIGQILSSSNGSGGGLSRGARWVDGANAGAFSFLLNFAPTYADSSFGFRCAWQSPDRVTYNANSDALGSVPSDVTNYSNGNTVTVLGNTGTLIKAGHTFASWNTAANGTGTSYTAGQTFFIGAGNVTLYAQYTLSCTDLAGGTWVAVPGNYGNPSFCVQKYAPSNVSSVPTSQTGTTPWVSISQTSAISTCSSLGTGYHLITNPEWMNVAANLANVASNWSGGTVGSGTLRRGHSDNSPTSACAADASDANAYVETTCIGTSTGTFVERRTSTLSNGSVVWDIGGNVWNWVNYNNSADKPTPAATAWYEYTAITGSTATPKSHLVPLNSAQSWWNDSWNSAQGIGIIYPGSNGSGGALLRGALWFDGAFAGPFSVFLDHAALDASSYLGLRCAYQSPNRVTYNANGDTLGAVPSDRTNYASGDTVTVLGNTGPLTKLGYTFASWNTAADGSGTNYTLGQTFTMGTANVVLYAKWILNVGLLIPKGNHTAITTAGTFPFAPIFGGGTVSFSGQQTWTSNSVWGPQLLFDNNRTIYDWCNDGTAVLSGIWTFPKAVSISKIFIVPRSTSDHFPTTMTLVVDGTTIGTYSPTSISNADGLTISYSGTGFYITPNISGTTWTLTSVGGLIQCVGELEFVGR